MSLAVIFITSLRKRGFIGDIYFHCKKIEKKQFSVTQAMVGGKYGTTWPATIHTGGITSQSALQGEDTRLLACRLPLPQTIPLQVSPQPLWGSAVSQATVNVLHSTQTGSAGEG